MEKDSGFLLIDKPSGITSHDVVDRVRRVTGIRKVGHGGTLDPFATGLLVLGVGRAATRELGTIIGKDKEYEAVAILGAVSDTQDRDGKIEETDGAVPTEDELRAAMTKFTGDIKQIPPMYSAKKVKGKKLYELARTGEVIEREPVDITIHELELIQIWFAKPGLPNQVSKAKFRVRCSSGTYIRTLAHDIGQLLDCGAYLNELRRTAIGDWKIENAIALDELSEENWVERLF
ncbi:MAG: tRNA pseudouridine(55) synthase TruB [Patescibacteria group bacterium]|nr:tRNA pseudouridine(55) synthase TruB [Patescibacteria group bacterium]